MIRTGLTPTDLLHADGEYVVGNADASRNGIAQMAQRMFMEPEELVSLLIDLVVTRVGEEILKKGLIDARVAICRRARVSACCFAQPPAMEFSATSS